MRFANEPTGPQDILEKPRDKEDNMRMLLDLNGGICEVVTGVSVGAPSTFNVPNRHLTLLLLICSVSGARSPGVQDQVRDLRAVMIITNR